MGSTITYHDRLRRARLDAGLTQPVLAERCASSTSTISAVERGTRDATAPLLFAWVRACGASLDWIASDPVRVPASAVDVALPELELEQVHA
jgi:transcriptional regulator with XRE-family HTH domain